MNLVNLFLSGLTIFLIVVPNVCLDISYFKNSKPSLLMKDNHKKPCPFIDKQLIFAHRGGDITKYHENSLEIFKDSARRGYSIEIDLMFLNSGHVIAFHDMNFKTKLGVNFPSESSIWEKVRKMSYKKVYEGRVYNKTAKVPLLSEVLNEVCSINSKIGLWFDIKTLFHSRYINKIKDALELSPCSCDSNQYIIAEVFNQVSAIAEMKEIFSTSRCKVLGALSFYEWQTSYTWDHMLDHTKKLAKQADIIDAHSAIYKKFPKIIKKLKDWNICTAVYGPELDLFKKDDARRLNIIIDDLIFKYNNTNYVKTESTVN